jgi:hypothetical protein
MEKTVFTDIPNQAGSSLAYSPSIFFDIRNSRWTNATGNNQVKLNKQKIKLNKQKTKWTNKQKHY